MSPDPSGLLAQKPQNPQSWNLYTYALNNPLINLDPNGLDCVYANNAGDDVESIDHNSDSGECGDHGGTWVPGYVNEQWSNFNQNTGMFQVASLGEQEFRRCEDTSALGKFTGKERDTESGLDNFGARYYGSSMGRFMSPDPSGLMYANPYNPQSLNLYAYAYNNPLINIDPTGLECVWDDGSYDSNDDSSTGAGAVDGSGNHTGCSGQGGTWIDHSYFTSNNMADWSSQGNSTLADMLTPSATVTFNYDASWASAYFNAWAAGQLPTSIQYGQNDPATLAMINRPYVQNQLAAYKAAGCPATGTKAGQGSGSAYGETASNAASGNTNYVQLEVGGYSGSITTSGGVTTVTLSNVSGISSLSGYSAGVGAINSTTGSHFNRNAIDSHSGAGQNVTQTFTQTMPSPCGGG